MSGRKPVQLTYGNGNIIVLCDDGSLWMAAITTLKWFEIKGPPATAVQGEAYE